MRGILISALFMGLIFSHTQSNGANGASTVGSSIQLDQGLRVINARSLDLTHNFIVELNEQFGEEMMVHYSRLTDLEADFLVRNMIPKRIGRIKVWMSRGRAPKRWVACTEDDKCYLLQSISNDQTRVRRIIDRLHH